MVAWWTGWLGIWADSSSPRPLVRHFDGLDLGEDFRLVAQEHFGSSSCVFGGCRRVDRYYASDLPVGAACTSAGRALRTWADDVRRSPEGAEESVEETCRFAGTTMGSSGAYLVNAQVQREMTIESSSKIGDRTITTPHQSVLVIEISEQG